MISETNNISIKQSKTKIAILTLGAIGFVLIGIWLWTISNFQNQPNSYIIKFVCIADFAFFGLCSFYGFLKLFDNKPGLIITKEGIHDNSSAVSGHFINWTSIIMFEITQIKSTRFLLIHVTNPQDFLDRTNAFKRFWMKQNIKMYGTPLSISSNSLQCNFDELVAILNNEKNKHVA